MVKLLMAVVFGGLLQRSKSARWRGESGAGELSDVSGKSLRGRALRGSGVEEVWNEPCGNGTDTRRFRQFSTFFDVNHPPVTVYLCPIM